MPTEILTGKAVLNGIQGTGGTGTITIAGFATFVLQALSPTQNFTVDALQDERGADVSLKATNPYKEIDLDFTPIGADRAAVAAVMNATLTPLMSVLISACRVTDCNGTWIYIGGGQKVQQAGQNAKITGLKLRKYDDLTQNASLATVVSGS